MNLSEYSASELQSFTRTQVLALAPEDKMKYLYSVQVRHAALERVAKELATLLSPYNETKILAIIGATGVGKTTLAKRLLKSLVERLANDGVTDQSSVPFIYMSTPANGAKSVSWTAIYEKALNTGDEVLVDRKHLVVESEGYVSVRPKRYKSLGALREALEKMLKNRHTRVMVIDEAFHLLRFGDYSAVMDTLKSLVDETHVKMILLGSYDLFDLASEYGQVARRAEILHFRRYNRKVKADCDEFARIVGKLQAFWPMQHIPNFVAISDELMEATLGCVGLLKALLLNALNLQCEKKGKWDPRFLARAAKSMKLLDRIRREIDVGEEKILGATYGESLFSGQLLEQVIARMRGGAVHA
jgi:hypothetical protein